MKFVSGEDQAVIFKDTHVLREYRENGELIDAWLSDDAEDIRFEKNGPIDICYSKEGVFGVITYPLSREKEHKLEDITAELYGRIFRFVFSEKSLYLVRIWNFVPNITDASSNGDKEEGRINYHRFNAGRYRAFKAVYGEDASNWPIPAASAVGTYNPELRIEFFGSYEIPVFLENKDQVPARRYSRRYGDLPPVFSRGAICSGNGQRLLIAAGTASVVGEKSEYNKDLYKQTMQSIQNLRVLVSQFNLKQYGIQYGFGLEDLVLLRVYYRRPEDRQEIEAHLRKTVDPDCSVSFMLADICREELLVEVEGVFQKKEEYGYSSKKKKYELVDGKIRVESLEVHVAEHCNIRCYGCDAMSPYNEPKLLSSSEVESTVNQLSRYFTADIFKLMGGEPLLNPDLIPMLEIVKRSGITDVVRLTTNGLLLHKMPDDFWIALDRLTISNYSSVPMSADKVELAEQKAREFGVVLNLKTIDSFNRVMLKEPIEDSDCIQNNYKDCWIRHRSLVVRDGVFFKCTRAAYMDTFLSRLNLNRRSVDPDSFVFADGIALDQENFRDITLEYLNDEKPLASCAYCLGASGELLPHRQLTTEEIKKGVI